MGIFPSRRSTLRRADMGLVDYSDSESSLCDSEAEEDGDAQPHQSKRVKVSSETSTTSSLPPLPARFRDLYSSTVRTSTQDDPSLHGGRKRVTPHVAGNWPGHVYLECKSEIVFFFPMSSRIRARWDGLSYGRMRPPSTRRKANFYEGVPTQNSKHYSSRRYARCRAPRPLKAPRDKRSTAF